MSPEAPRLVLASASPRRLQLMRQIGLEPEVVPVSMDESVVPGEDPLTHVTRLAVAKAETVALDHPGALVVGGDTVVVRRASFLGKPATPPEAVDMLLSLSGQEHEVLTALALAGAGETVSAMGRAVVRFRRFDRETAAAYVHTGEPMDKAGAYGIQGAGAALVEEIRGDYYAVVGFPIVTFLGLLEGKGWRYSFGSMERLV